MTIPERIYTLWPDAVNIRPAGRCPACHSHHQWSLQTLAVDGLVADIPGYEHCGYWCAACGWSNAGSRLIEAQS